MEKIKAIIVSDGKPGHINQSIALCKYKGWEYEIVKVAYKKKWLKALSFLFDFFKIYTSAIFTTDRTVANATLLIAAGSSTYYPTKVLARESKAISVTMMLPKNYRLDFDYIFAPFIDNAPPLPNIIELPINLVYVDSGYNTAEMDKRFVFEHDKEYIGVVIGGPNTIFDMRVEDLRPIFDYLLSLENVHIVATTSRRTPIEIEDWLSSLGLDFLLKYSEDAFNPIPAFLNNCKNIIITCDSTSMISEAVVGGDASVTVTMLPSKKYSKFHILVENLEQLGALHIFDGSLGANRAKINLRTFLPTIAIPQAVNSNILVK